MKTLVKNGRRDVVIEVNVEGEGPDVVLLASALRGAADYSRLQADLASAGFRSLAINMRGVEGSTGPAPATLAEVVEDVAAVIGELCTSPAHVVGHALGNIVARATASYRPDLVRSVVVMPCGGHNLSAHPVSEHVLRAFVRCHDETLPADERREALSTAFFAPGNDPGDWLDGWWSGGGAVAQAAQRADPESWWRAGTAPLLILQPMTDAMASPEVGREAATAIGERATYAEIPDCGHAILPEQPELIAQHIVAFLRSAEAAPDAR